MLVSLNDYIRTMNDTLGLTRTLGVIHVCRDEDGTPGYIVGNNSIIFKIRRGEKLLALKCYTRPKRNLRRIYGEACLCDELNVVGSSGRGGWVDVVVSDWIEGRTLRRAISDNLGNPEGMKRLADAFDRFALDLLGKEWAHGDVKPENIIVDDGGAMHLVDFDAVFRPEFAGEQSDETGTASFQHPARTAEYFCKAVDDYPLALVSSALRALSADPGLHLRFDTDTVLLVDPVEAVAGRSEALNAILDLFSRKCMAVHYRIAGKLRSPVPRLSELGTLLSYAVEGGERSADDAGRVPELAARNGMWGYAVDGRFVIPPVYDDGFEFCDGLAAVRIGGRCHRIRPDGSPAGEYSDCAGTGERKSAGGI